MYGHTLYPRRNTSEAIFWANDEKKLDIEGFRMVDLLTQGYVPSEEEATVGVKGEYVG